MNGVEGNNGRGEEAFSDHYSQNDKPRPSLTIFESFEDILDYFEKTRLGTYYERQKGLTPKYYHGVKHKKDFGTITYVTDDGRVALIWAFACRLGWFYLYPSSEQFEYFYEQAPDHIRRILTQNKKEHKL